MSRVHNKSCVGNSSFWHSGRHGRWGLFLATPRDRTSPKRLTFFCPSHQPNPHQSSHAILGHHLHNIIATSMCLWCTAKSSKQHTNEVIRGYLGIYSRDPQRMQRLVSYTTSHTWCFPQPKHRAYPSSLPYFLQSWAPICWTIFVRPSPERFRSVLIKSYFSSKWD